MSPQALSVRYALYYATIFVAIGAHLPFWPLWLEARGLTAAEIGLLLALGSWVKLVASPGLAHLSDRAGWGKGTIVLLTAVSLARSEEHTSELQSLMRTSYAAFCLK